MSLLRYERPASAPDPTSPGRALLLLLGLSLALQVAYLPVLSLADVVSPSRTVQWLRTGLMLSPAVAAQWVLARWITRPMGRSSGLGAGAVLLLALLFHLFLTGLTLELGLLALSGPPAEIHFD